MGGARNDDLHSGVIAKVRQPGILLRNGFQPACETHPETSEIYRASSRLCERKSIFEADSGSIAKSNSDLVFRNRMKVPVLLLPGNLKRPCCISLLSRCISDEEMHYKVHVAHSKLNANGCHELHSTDCITTSLLMA